MPRAARPLLVVAAWAPELAVLRAAPAAVRRGVVTRVVGVGLVEAAAGTARALAAVRPRAIVLVGTAGAYPGAAAAVGEALVARRVSLHDGAAARGEAYFPRPLPTTLETDRRLRRALAAGRALADVACPPAITATGAGARRAARASRAALENLEAFAVGRAAAAAGVPFAAVLGVANRVGPAAHAEWRAHAAAAAAAACRAVLGLFRGPTRR